MVKLIVDKNSYFYFLFCFFVLGNFYWYPFFEFDLILKVLKYLFLIIALILFFLGLSKNKILEKDIFIIYLFASWLVFAFLYFIFFQFIDVFLQVLLFFIFFLMGGGVELKKNYNIFVIFFLIFSLSLMIFSYFFDAPIFYKILEEDNRSYNLSQIGYGQSRTTWGVGITFITFFLFWYLKSIEANKYLTYSILILAFFSVLVSGSRGALLYFLILFIYIFIYEIKGMLRILSIFLTSLFIGLFYFVLGGAETLVRGDSDISSGRFEGFQYFNMLIENNFFWGYEIYGGYSLDDFRTGYSRIHNAFINYLLKYGVYNFLFLIAIMISIFVGFVRSHTPKPKVLYLLVFCGMISAFLEPDTFLSYGHHVLIFWFVLGMLYSEKNFERVSF